MQESGGFRLIVRRGPQPNQTFDLNKDIITLGRDITNDIVINDPEVSRHHLRLTRGADGYNIEDLGSTNGTFIGGQRLSGVRPLKRGDLIGLGETVTLVYEAIRPAPSAGGPPPTQSPQPRPQPQDYGGGNQPLQGYDQQPGSYPQQQPPAQEPDPYGGAGQPAYEGQGAAGGGYGTPPPPPDQGEYGYEQDYGGYAPSGSSPGYDPYAVREDGPHSPWRWVILGCGGLLLFCCCATVFGFVIIDQADLWCDIPIFSDIITPLIGLIGEALNVIEDARTC
jgi:hypothetical protein